MMRWTPVREWLFLMVAALFPTSSFAQCEVEIGGTSGFWTSSYFTDEIFFFDELGNFMDSITPAGLNGPRSITVNSEGEIYVASQLTSEVFVLDSNGNTVEVFSVPGLIGPTGGVIAPNGDYYLCSFNSDEVFRIDSSHNVVETLTSPGLNGPNCVLFWPDGRFAVTGQLSNDVHFFDALGNPTYSFPAFQSSVMGAAVDNQGRILVAAGSSDDINLFDCDGQLLDSWDLPGGPQSIAVREDGRIFVTTFYTDEVVQLDGLGNVIESWTGGSALRGIEFFPGSLPTFTRGDADGDGSVNISDAISSLNYLFAGATTPLCLDALDADDSGAVNIADPIYVLGYLFQAGPAPAEPFATPSVDSTPDNLGCLEL